VVVIYVLMTQKVIIMASSVYMYLVRCTAIPNTHGQ